MPRKTKFLENWLVNLAYNGWLSKKSDFWGRCSYCFKEINISSITETAFKSHKKNKMRNERAPLFKSSNVFAKTDQNGSSSSEIPFLSTQDQSHPTEVTRTSTAMRT